MLSSRPCNYASKQLKLIEKRICRGGYPLFLCIPSVIYPVDTSHNVAGYVPQRSRIRPRPRRRGCLSRRTGGTTYPDTSGTSNLRLLNLSGEVRNVEFEVTQRIRRDSGPRRTGYSTYPTGSGTSTDRLFNVSDGIRDVEG